MPPTNEIEAARMQRPRRARHCCLLAGWFITAMAQHAVAEEVRSPYELKSLTLEELLDTKVISGARTLEDWKTTPAAIGFLPQETIHGAGATRLAEALRLAPGLNVSRYIGSSYAISARGFNSNSSNKLQVMMDGRSLYTPLFSGVFWEIEDTMLEDIDRIEVVRGPGATLWGSNAVNGVINIVTKNAKETQGGLVTVAAGTEERSTAAVRYGGKIGNATYYRTYFKYQNRDDQIFTSGASARDGMQQRQGGIRLDSSVAGGNQLTFQGDIYGNTFGINGRPDARNSGGNVLGRWTHAFSPQAELQVQTYYDHGRRDVPLQFREERATFDLDLQHHFKIGERQSVVLGGGYRISSDETDQNGRTFIFSPPNRTLDLTRFFVQDAWVLIPDKFTLTAGSAFERNDYTGWEVQPTVRLAWTPGEHQFVWAAVSRAVRAPTRADTDSRFIPNPATGFVFIRGTPDFQSEDALAYELGYRFQPHRRLFFDLATFYNDYRHLRTLEPSAPLGLPLLVGNEREGSTYGAEVTITFQPLERWQLTGSVSHLHENFRFRPGSRDPTGGTVEANDPPWIASLHSAVNLPHGIELNFVLRYAAALPNPAVPSYLTMDVRVAFHPAKNFEAAVVGQNLLDSSHPESGGGAEVQRGVYGQLTHRF